VVEGGVGDVETVAAYLVARFPEKLPPLVGWLASAERISQLLEDGAEELPVSSVALNAGLDSSDARRLCPRISTLAALEPEPPALDIDSPRLGFHNGARVLQLGN